MITLKLTDSTNTLTLPLIAPPLSQNVVEGATDVVTLDNNVSTYFTYNKSLWEVSWSLLTEQQYNDVKGFYDRQFTLFKYPLLTIEGAGAANVTNLPVRMYMPERNIVNNCGDVEEVEVQFRESRQIGS